MTLRPGVTRSPATPSVARTRPDPGWLYCDALNPDAISGGSQTDSGSIPLNVDQSYKRVFLSATVFGLETVTGSE